MLPNLFNSLPRVAFKNKTLKKSQTLFHQNDKVFAMFFVVSGGVSLRRQSEMGEQIIIHSAHAGETFAEAGLFSAHYHCDAVATKKTQIIVIDKQAVCIQMQKDSKFAMNLSAHFARQIQNYRRRLEIQSIKNAEQRVYAAISDGMLQADIKTLAAQINLSYEATYRALAGLVACNKLVKIARGKYIISGQAHHANHHQ